MNKHFFLRNLVMAGLLMGLWSGPGKNGFASQPHPSNAILENWQMSQATENGVEIKFLLTPFTMPGVSYQEEKLTLIFPDAKLSHSFEKNIPLPSFIDKALFTEKTNEVVLEIFLKSPFDYALTQSDKTTVLSINKKQMGSEKILPGEKISLNFQDIEVRNVLQIVADFADLNLVATDAVKGNITLRLDATPWEQALDIILQARNLVKHKEGKVLFVTTKKEQVLENKETLQAQSEAEKMITMVMEVISIQYAKAEEMAAFLKQEGNSLLSDRGSLTVDARTNTLLVKESPQKILEIKKLIALLDRPVKQVQIEARIVVARDDQARALGARFGTNYKSDSLNVSGSLKGARESNLGTSLTGLGLENRLNVSLPVNPAMGSIGFVVSKLPGGILLDLELSALESEGRAKIVSSPSIITSNRKQAIIESGEEIPYKTTSTSNGVTEVSIQFKKAVLSLKVIPQITPSNQVLMSLDLNQDSRGKKAEDGTLAIDTQHLQTEVLANDGETIVLGGVYRQIHETGSEKVPFLSSIPFLGVFFKKIEENHDKQELLIFVTPKIIRDGKVS